MITDFLLSAFWNFADFLVGLLPDTPNWWTELFLEGSAGVDAEFGARGWLVAANYFLPIKEGVEVVLVVIAGYALIASVRWLLKLIPGLG